MRICFFHGSFNEKIIRFDLSTRKNEKRDFYIKHFNKFIEDHRMIKNVVRTQFAGAAGLTERVGKCKKEASRLLDIVYEY